MRKNLEILSKKGTSLLLIVFLLASYFIPIVPVFAVSNTNSLAVSFKENSVSVHTITFYPNNETEETSVINNIANGASVNLGTPESYGFTEPEGKEFDGWLINGEKYAAGQNYTVTSDTTVVAQWVDVVYTVTFDSNGGSGYMESVEVAKGQAYRLPANGFVAPKGQQFDGWNLSNDPTNYYFPNDDIIVTEDITITPNWNYILHFLSVGTITLDETQGKVKINSDDPVAYGFITLKENETATITAIPNDGYRFVEWELIYGSDVIATNSNPVVEVIMGTQGLNYYAVFEEIPVTYNVILNPNNGTEEMSTISNLANGTSIGLGTPESYGFTEPEGKVFDGWLINGEKYAAGQNYTVTSDVTAVAQWNIAITSANANITIPVAGATPDFNPVSSNCAAYTVEYKNWYLHESPYPSLNNESLYESGKNYSLRVRFSANEGYQFTDDAIFTINDEETSCYGARVDREYTFYNISAPTNYTVAFDLDGGTMNSSTTQSVISGEYVIEPSQNPTREGFLFIGWYIVENDRMIGYDFNTPVTEDITIYAGWEPIFTITYNFNGGTRNGEGTYVIQSVGYGMILTEENLINYIGVTPPNGKVLDAVLVNGVRYELDSELDLNKNLTIEYIWKDAIIKGDINGDNKLTLYEAFSILRIVILNNTSTLSEEKVKIMDYNDDGEVTLYDAFSILRQAILS